MRNVVNPSLYQALKRLIDAGMLPGRDVRIKNEGQQFKGQYVTDPLDTKRKKLKKEYEGETYWVCCPQCGDTRYRLCINNKWNVYDTTVKHKNNYLIHCFNEECQSSVPGFIDKMTNLVRQYVPKGISKLPPKPIKEQPHEDRKMALPGLVARVDQLPPTHPAFRFLVARGYDPYLLGPNYEVSFCYTSNYPFATNRIVFPVYMHKELVGWQARFIDAYGGGDVLGLHFCRSCRAFSRHESKQKICTRCSSDSLETVPKYWTAPGFKKGEALMNYDSARNFPFCVIVEGPMDVLRVGSDAGPCLPGPAVALYGHSLSPKQKLLIWDRWKGKVVVIMLDADAYKDSQNICKELQASGAFKAVLPILLPDNRDPSDCDHELLWSLIYAEAKKANVDLIA